MKLYMAVTPDKYELPLAVADTVLELAQTVNRSASVIYSSITKNTSGKTKGMKFVKVELEDEMCKIK